MINKVFGELTYEYGWNGENYNPIYEFWGQVNGKSILYEECSKVNRWGHINAYWNNKSGEMRKNGLKIRNYRN